MPPKTPSQRALSVLLRLCAPGSLEPGEHWELRGCKLPKFLETTLGPLKAFEVLSFSSWEQGAASGCPFFRKRKFWDVSWKLLGGVGLRRSVVLLVIQSGEEHAAGQAAGQLEP